MLELAIDILRLLCFSVCSMSSYTILNNLKLKPASKSWRVFEETDTFLYLQHTVSINSFYKLLLSGQSMQLCDTLSVYIIGKGHVSDINMLEKL